MATVSYVSVPRKAWVSATDTPEDRPSCTVFEADCDPVYTGILDANGTPLYRIVTRDRIGFVVRG